MIRTTRRRQLPLAAGLAAAGLATALLGAGCGTAGKPAAGAADAQPLASLPARTAAPDPSSPPSPAGPSSPATPSAPATPATPSGPLGSIPVRDAVSGYSLTLPPGFVRIADVRGFDQALARSKDALKLTAAQITTIRTALQHDLRLLGVNRSTGSSVVVLVSSANGQRADDMATWIPAVKAQLASLHATNVKIVPVTVGGRPGLRVTATLKTARGTISEVEYSTIANDKLYVVTLSGHPIRAADLALLGRSLQFTAATV